MLVLTRHVDEAIMIGEETVVKVLAISGRQVRIGVSAPSDVAVHREEVYQRIQSEHAADQTGEQ